MSASLLPWVSRFDTERGRTKTDHLIAKKMDFNKATNERNVRLHEEKNCKASETMPKSSIYPKELFESDFTLSFHRKPHLRSEDIRSVGTMSNSDTKSHSTMYSSPTLDTTPSASRAQSPILSPTALHEAMEIDLVGIGGQIKPPTSNAVKRRPSTRPSDMDIQLSGWQSPESGMQTPMQTADLIHTGNAVDVLVDVLDSDSSSASDPFDVDLDLENTASIALSRCFGVSLDRLARPMHIVDAFAGFKSRCTEILRQDQSFTTIDWDDDGFSCFDAEEGDLGPTQRAYDRTSGQLQHSKSLSNKRSLRPRDKFDGQDGSEAGSDNERTPGGGSKRLRVEQPEEQPGPFSCPFRKRNPIRFKLEGCANVPYSNMTLLKRHILLQHTRVSCPHCGQPRPNAIEHTPEICLGHRNTGQHRRNQDPEDGVDLQAESLLRSRAPGSKIRRWRPLWRLLFPYDDLVPSSEFEPVIEHHDVANEGYRSFVTNTTNDILELLVHRQLVDGSQTAAFVRQHLSSTIQKNAKELLRNSKYAAYDLETPEGFSISTGPNRPTVSETPTSTFGRTPAAMSADHGMHETQWVGASPIVVTPQNSPPEQLISSNERRNGGISSSASIGHPVLPTQVQDETSRTFLEASLPSEMVFPSVTSASWGDGQPISFPQFTLQQPHPGQPGFSSFPNGDELLGIPSSFDGGTSNDDFIYLDDDMRVNNNVPSYGNMNNVTRFYQ